MGFTAEDEQNFIKAHQAHLERMKIFDKFMDEVWTSPALEIDECQSIYDHWMSRVDSAPEPYHSAYERTLGIIPNIDPHNAESQKAFSDWVSFIKNKNFENIDADNAVHILKFLVQQHDNEEFKFGMASKGVNFFVDLVSMKSKAVKVAKSAFSVVGGTDAIKSLFVKDIREYFQDFSNRWSDRPDVILKVLEDSDITLTPEVNRLFSISLFKHLYKDKKLSEQQHIELTKKIEDFISNQVKDQLENRKANAQDFEKFIQALRDSGAVVDEQTINQINNRL